ncbi:MAG: hypothetical protein KDB60_00945 [Propionibacteriaceae bacterium]|nr:hypothetical protein [Propionibacteriaceae bacterium]MCB1282190.1 hypothetical protein [Salinibacterium sp.]
MFTDVETRHVQTTSTTTTPLTGFLDRVALRFGVALVEWAGHAEAREVARLQRRQAREERLRDRARQQAEFEREQLRLDSNRLYFNQAMLYRNLQ